MASSLLTVFLLLAYAVAGAIAVLLHKLILSTWRHHGFYCGSMLAAGALIAYGCSFMILMSLLNRLALSILAPVSLGLSLVAAVIAGVWLLGDVLRTRQVLGVGLILIGSLISLVVNPV